MAYYAMMTGIDLTKLDAEGSFSDVKTEGGRTQVERYKNVSIKEGTADFLRRGMRELIVTGTPKDAADQIEAIVSETGLSGFNYTPFVSPGSYIELIDHVVPELQRRGLMPTERKAGTFRERVFGAGRDRLPQNHRVAKTRVS